MQRAADGGRRIGSAAERLFVVMLTTLLLLWPVAFNKSVILYPDTRSYIGDAAGVIYGLRDALVSGLKSANSPDSKNNAALSDSSEAAQTISGRSIYYGGFAVIGWRAGSFTIIAGLQALWCAVALLLVLTRFGITRPRDQLAVAASLAIFTSLGFFAGTLLPDVFAGIAIAALGMLLVFGRRLAAPEAIFWVLSLAFAGATHNAILLAVGATFAIVALAARQRPGAGHGLIAGGLALAIVGGLVATPLLERTTGVKVINVPFLLARSIEDGTGARLLADDCSKVGYSSCRFLPHLPLSANELLWNPQASKVTGETTPTGWANLPPAERLAISREANTIALRAFLRYPLQQVTTSLGNWANQSVNLDIEKFGWPETTVSSYRLMRDSDFAPEGEQYKASRIATGTFPLGLLSGLWFAVYLLSAIAIVGMVLTAWRRQLSIDLETRLFVGTAITGIILNAAVCGILSSGVGRYQSRVSWLLLLSAILLAHALRRATGRRHAG